MEERSKKRVRVQNDHPTLDKNKNTSPPTQDKNTSKPGGNQQTKKGAGNGVVSKGSSSSDSTEIATPLVNGDVREGGNPASLGTSWSSLPVDEVRV